MKLNFKQFLSTNRAKKLYLGLAILLLLFFVCNDLIIPWYVNQGGVLEVPSIVGIKFETAQHLLDSIGLEARKGDVRLDREHPAGVVIIQNPPEGAKVKKGRRVYLTVSGGELLVIVPTLKGRTIRDARFVLEREGLKLGAVEYEPSEELPAGTVIEQKLSPGAKVKRDVYVSVVISQGSASQKVAVPDVTGKTLTDATVLLSSSWLKVGNISYVPSSDLLPNTVVDQFPRVGEMVMAGQAIDLFIVQGGEKKKEILEN